MLNNPDAIIGIVILFAFQIFAAIFAFHLVRDRRRESLKNRRIRHILAHGVEGLEAIK